ncbi:MAG TPA: polysaccharide biosynthesis/export family protein [Verrucomicrobiae bacterium]|jgi:polysaccharide export outer membrane protein
MKLFWKLSGAGFFLCGLLLAAAMFSGCASTSGDPVFSDNPHAAASPASSTPSSEADAAVFRVGETVVITFSGGGNVGQDSQTPIMPQHQEPIKEDGTITLDLIGSVKAAGKTPGELQNEIHDLYVPKYYVRLTVTVSSQDRVFYVGGEVVKPGVFQYLGETTVTKAIQSAGDFTDFANRGKVWLIRANGQRIKVNCTKALENPSLDPPVYPGDQIQVPRRLI